MRVRVDLDWLPTSPLHRLGGARWGRASLLCAACTVCPSGILSPMAARICHIRGENALEGKVSFNSGEALQHLSVSDSAPKHSSSLEGGHLEGS